MLTNTERQQIVEEVNAGTYGIDEALDDIAAAQKGEEVRKALYAEALVLNREGHAGSTDMIARQQIANLQTSVNGQIGTLRTEVGDDIDDLETALNSGLATQNGRIAAQNATIANVVANYNVEYGSTELWASTGETGALAAGTTVTLSEDVSHFDYIDIYSFCGNSNVLDTVPVDAKLQSSQGYALRWVNLSDPGSGSYKAYVRIIETRLHIIGTTLTIDHQVTYRNGEEVNISGAEITQSNRSTYMGELGIMKIVGRKITANTEIEDVRIGADGTEYASAGQAVRAQVTALESAIPAVDSRLSTQGAAADAKVAGDKVAELKRDLSQEIARATAEDERLEKLFSAPTQEAVDNWLNAHPEATTTVQDGSITYNKLNANVKSEFNALNSDVMTNLFEPLLCKKTISGVTFTLNDADNTYTVQGTSTSAVYDTIGTVSLEPGTYKLLGLVQSGSATTWRINLYAYAMSGGALIAQDLGSGKVFTISTAGTFRLVLYIDSGVTIDIDFKPMITANLNATINDYVPYNGTANRLNENVSALSYDLYKSMLTGDKIHNDNVGWMVDIAKTWLDNASKIWYSYDGNLFYDNVIETDGKYPMTCSVFVSAMIFGISFYNSKYNGKISNSYNNFAYSDQTLLALLRNESFASEYMLPYFIKKGYAFIPEPDLSNVEMGDILYVGLNQATDPTFHNVSHSAIFAYPLNSTQYRVWEVGGDAGPVQTTYTFDYARQNVKFAVRLPFKTWQTNVRRKTLSTAEFTGATPLASLFDFNYNYVANMWKVTLLGTAYGAGGDQSSIYLLRTNMAGAISAKTKVFEGEGAACRKLDANNAIYDVGEKYDQPVTVIVEWLGS